jgi:DNA methylase
MARVRDWPAGLPTVLRLPLGDDPPLPEALADADVRFPETLVSVFVERLTAPGDVVLDPFVGFGTTVVVAERLGRKAWGVELDDERATFARTRVQAPERILTADARSLDVLPLPSVKLCFASPPYSSPGEPCEALAAYRAANSGYGAYLIGLKEVYRKVAARLTPDGWVVIEASNLRAAGQVTPLAWDIARAVGEILPFVGEIVIHWEPTFGGYGYDHSYCLLFSAGADHISGSGRPAAAHGGGAAARGSSGGGSSSGSS